MGGTIVLLILLVVVFITIKYGYIDEIEKWNNGICKECGGKFELAETFEDCSYYQCTGCDNSVTIFNLSLEEF